jgi:hypothetical protein
MDLTTISGASAYQQGQTLTQVATSVDAKALNIAKEEGNADVALIQAAGQIGAPGVGGQLNVQG